ncbi:MAG: hydroxyphenylacetyl-CoA thioesterase PaaI [Gammaproteobacteria bacterium]
MSNSISKKNFKEQPGEQPTTRRACLPLWKNARPRSAGVDTVTDLELARACRDAMYEKDTASRAIGIDVDIPAAGSAIARMTVTARMVNGFAICHGGYVFTLADTAFAFACNSHGRVSVAAGASIEYLRPARQDDQLEARAREVYRGRSSGVTKVEVFNQDHKLVAVFRGRSSILEREILSDTGKNL